jgi:hypothetical protein
VAVAFGYPEAAAADWLREQARTKHLRVRVRFAPQYAKDAWNNRTLEHERRFHPEKGVLSGDWYVPWYCDWNSPSYEFEEGPVAMTRHWIVHHTEWHRGDVEAALQTATAQAQAAQQPTRGRKKPGQEPFWDWHAIAAEAAWCEAEQRARGQPWVRKQLIDEVKRIAQQWETRQPSRPPSDTMAEKVADGIIRARRAREEAATTSKQAALGDRGRN